MRAWSDRLPAYSGFVAVLSAAGLPIYIYAPKYYADTYGVSLTALGAILFGLRLFEALLHGSSVGLMLPLPVDLVK